MLQQNKTSNFGRSLEVHSRGIGALGLLRIAAFVCVYVRRFNSIQLPCVYIMRFFQPPCVYVRRDRLQFLAAVDARVRTSWHDGDPIMPPPSPPAPLNASVPYQRDV